jgi:hypothetical protein
MCSAQLRPHTNTPVTQSSTSTTRPVSISRTSWELHSTHLHDLDIVGCKGSTVLDYKITLHRLSLSDIELLGSGTGWRSVLLAIAGQLPNLRKVILSEMRLRSG